MKLKKKKQYQVQKIIKNYNAADGEMKKKKKSMRNEKPLTLFYLTASKIELIVTRNNTS